MMESLVYCGLALLALQIVQVCTALGLTDMHYSFEVKVHSYRNPDHKLQSGNPCLKGHMECSNRFIFCLTTADTPLVDQNCPLGRLTFDEQRDNITFPVGSEIVPGSSIPNPMIFNMTTGPWPGEFNLFVEVYHSGNRIVGQLTVRKNLTDKAFTAPAVFHGEMNTMMSIQLSFRFVCSEDFYGDLCDMFCTPQNDPGGHFTCNSITGQKECLTGYMDTSNGCTTLCDTPTCGTPVDPSGLCMSQPCMNGGECVDMRSSAGGSSYVCTCASGFEGSNCERAVPVDYTGNTISEENQTDVQVPQTGGLSGGGIAGVVIGLFMMLVLMLLLIVGISVIIWYYRSKTIGKFDISKSDKALDNPNYSVVEMMRTSSPSIPSAISPATVVQTQLPQPNSDNAPTLERTLDNDNPLYFSTTHEQDIGNTNVSLPRQPVNGNQNDGEDYIFPSEVSHPPPIARKPPLLPLHYRQHSQQPAQTTVIVDTSTTPNTSIHDNCSNRNLHHSTPSSPLNPYGEYGDETLRRVVSQRSVNVQENESESEPETEIGTGEVFDNPDYGLVEYL